MKLKILPPTLRANYRYLVLDIKSETSLSKNDLVPAIWEAAIHLYGELETSNFNLWVMKFFDLNHEKENIFNHVKDKNSFYYYNTILRCQRNFEEKVRDSLTMLYRYKGNKISISTIGKSGTIKSAVNKFINC
ncbi:MAG: ribonuclease P [Methanobrevibacter sp.]|jgi:ribonuclease P/MRP protein subunit POP5|nr:ribonuclease P [Candidatus Methanovirga basalitermitum]